MKNILRFVVTFILATVFQYTAVAGQGALLGIQPGFPKIDFTGTTGQGCSYNASTDTLTITGTPGLTLFGPLPAGPLSFISGGLVTMTLNINDAGTLSGGSFSVTGSISSPTAYSSPLLTGTFVGGDYGLVDINPTAGATDVGDLRAVVTGGSMAPLFTTSSSDMGVAPLSLELSTYSGTMTSDWSCGRAKGVIGTVPGQTPGEGACSQGYWKNHPDAWPVNTLTLGGVSYTKSALLAILKMKTKGDKSIIMATQLIAAKLNVAGGSDPSCIQTTINAADTWLSNNAPGGVPGNVSEWNGGEDTKDDLDGYNNGMSGCAGACTR